MSTTGSLDSIFGLQGRVAIITGGAGMLGRQHAAAIAIAGGWVALVDLPGSGVFEAASKISADHGTKAVAFEADILDAKQMKAIRETIMADLGSVDILINNAANNPKVESPTDDQSSRFETFALDRWRDDLEVILTGALVCCQVFCEPMVRAGKGVVLNIASDLAVIAPNQRIYRKDGIPDDAQFVKPVSYSVAKTGLLGLTRYLASYWADKGIRVNAISPGGVYNGQPEDFVAKLTSLIPMARMANLNEYQGAILFLCSDASSYMTGANMVVDGGRTCW